MLRPEEITTTSITRSDFKEELQESIAEYFHNYLSGEAHEMLLALQRVLADPALENSDKWKTELYEEFLWLMFLSIPLLPEDQVIELLERHLLFALRRNIIVEELLGRFLQLYYDTVLGGDMSRKLVEAISRNAEPVVVRPTGAVSPPGVQPVSEWIKKLLRVHTANTRITTLEVIELLESEPNVSKNEELKDLVRRLLLLFARVQSVFLSNILDPLFEPLQEQYAREDEAEPTTEPRSERGAGGMTSAAGLESLKEQYAAFRQSQKNILDEEDRLLAETRGDLTQLKRALARASRSRAQVTLIACLRILARQHILDDALKSSKSWLQAISEIILDRYADTGDAQAAARAVENGNITVAVVAEFIELLLRDKLDMSDNESALVAMDLGKLMGDEYLYIAYGNQQSGNFEWAPRTIRDGMLVMEK